MLKVYHNPHCKKSRAGLAYLKSRIKEFELIEYLKTGLTEKELNEILLKSNLKPIDLVRRDEEIFKKELKGKSFTDEEWVKIICENPKLLKRPLVIGKYKAVVGDPVERIELVIK
jgi:arsenate reductase (glutaredoxin)